MKIGLIGYGKMGKDIFTLLSGSLNAEFVIYVRHDAQADTDAVMKALARQHRRKLMTQEQLLRRQNAFRFTESLHELADCEIILETVTENPELKQEIFRETAGIVSENCLLLTNTSSLDIRGIFSEIPRKERCAGMHFFYPVRLSEFAEISLLPETSGQTRTAAQQILTDCGKKSVIFSGDYQVWLNQILSCMISHALVLCDLFQISVRELSAAWEPLFPMADPFVMLDSIGLGLLAENQMHFCLSRNHALLESGCRTMQKWLDSGCGTGTHCFLDFIAQREQPTGNPCQEAELYMTAFLLNETAAALSESGADSQQLLAAVSSTLGLAAPLPEYYHKYGTEAVSAALGRLYQKTGFASYQNRNSLFQLYYN